MPETDEGPDFLHGHLELISPSCLGLGHTTAMLTYTTFVLIPRNNKITRHFHNAYFAFTELTCKPVLVWRERGGGMGKKMI